MGEGETPILWRKFPQMDKKPYICREIAVQSHIIIRKGRPCLQTTYGKLAGMLHHYGRKATPLWPIRYTFLNNLTGDVFL